MTEMSEAQKNRINEITFDEQKLFEMSTSNGGEHEYAADYRIGFRYGFNRGKVAGYKAGLQDPSRSEVVPTKSGSHIIVAKELWSQINEKSEAMDRVLGECEILLTRLFESFDYALKENLKLTASEQYGLLFLLDEKGRMIFKLSKDKELLNKIREIRKG